MRATWIRHLTRIAFAVLLAYEVLAWTGVISAELEFTWRGLVGTLLAVWLFIEAWSFSFLRSKRGALHPAAYVCAFASVLFDALGDIQLWYGAYHWYDQLMHLCGGMTSLIVLWSIVDRIVADDVKIRHRWISYALAFGFACFGGILYEIEEYTEDVFTGSNRLGSGFDTANDLLLNGCGHLIALLILVTVHRIKKSHGTETLHP